MTLMITDKLNCYFTMQEMAGDNQKEAYTGFVLILKLSRVYHNLISRKEMYISFVGGLTCVAAKRG